MSSVPNSFVFGSASTAGFSQAFESYRRSQLLLTDSISASNTEDEFDYDDQISVVDEENEVGFHETSEHPVSYDPNAVVGSLQWDEDLTPQSPTAADVTPTVTRPFLLPVPHRPARTISQETARPPAIVTPSVSAARETTPLLHKATSLTFAEPVSPRPTHEGVLPSIVMPTTGGMPTTMTRRYSQVSTASRRSHRPSVVKDSRALQGGQSTFGQTLFNAIAILLGIGMLSEPLAFAYAGWIGGMSLIIFYGFITCYTAKILAHIILDDPKLRSYSDIGKKAFGVRSGPLISALFCLELFTVSVALVTLFADSLHSVLPTYSTTAYKILGLLILVPTVLMPLNALSYASILGILSTLLLVVVVFIDGFSKKEAPGSLWSPADTSLGFGTVGELGLSFGLFMAGFSGHAVIPSLARDMVDPSQFDTMIDYAFGAATLVYTTIGVAGYLMFGNNVSDEFSKNLMEIKGFNPFLNKLALWGLVLTPLSKFALATRPLNITIEIILGIDTSSHSPDDHEAPSKPSAHADDHARHDRFYALKKALTVVERTVFTMLSVAVSILVPEFSSMMAFLGSFSAFLLCVIGPVSAKSALVGRWSLCDTLLLIIAIIMAVWGTAAAFWSAT